MEIKDVEKLAELARIELSEEEKKGLLKDFEGILNYIKEIEKVKVDDTQVIVGETNVWREDETLARDFAPELLAGQFPHSQDGYLKVKKIL
jgi:aspartyl-tRNA(Asn)/glutamyl-tRNA(Gln) amidotransferase subunit C